MELVGFDIRFLTIECKICPGVVVKIFSLRETTKEFVLMKYNLKCMSFKEM